MSGVKWPGRRYNWPKRATRGSKLAQLEVTKLESALKAQDEELKTAQSSLQAEFTRNARISQSCNDLEVRVQKRDQQIQSLEQKHVHARESLEHYRASVKEQRDQNLNRHESQVYRMQQELIVIQRTLMVKQEEISRLIRDNERLIGECRQQTKEVSQQRDAIARLKGDLGIANAAIARGEGAKELLTQQLEAKAKEVVDVRSDVTAGQQRESDLVKRLEEAEAELSTYRTAKEVDDLGG